VEVVDLTLLDGTRVRVRAPRSLDLGAMGFTPRAVIAPPGATTVPSSSSACCVHGLFVGYRTPPPFDVPSRPDAVYRRSNGTAVRFYEGSDLFPFDLLVYRFGPWTVTVFDGGPASAPRWSRSERTGWARDLDGRVTGDGYLVLTVPPSRGTVVANAASDVTFGATRRGALELYTAGPSATWCPAPADVTTRTPSGFAAEVRPDVAVWCDTDAGIRIHASGTAAFVNAVVGGLRVSRLAPARPARH
jgi:hypothetical protein